MIISPAVFRRRRSLCCNVEQREIRPLIFRARREGAWAGPSKDRSVRSRHVDARASAKGLAIGRFAFRWHRPGETLSSGPMKISSYLLGLLGLTGPLAVTATGQLIHVTATLDDAYVLFRADDASIPWDNTPAFVTEFDFRYDLRVPIGTHDPRSFWHMKGYSPQVRRTFDVTRPIDFASVFDRALSFEYFRSDDSVYEDFRLMLVFNTPIGPGGPPYPLPPLGLLDDFRSSGFSVTSGNSLYNFDHLNGAFGGGKITALTAEFIPIPESSSYALGAAVVLMGLIAVRRRRWFLRRPVSPPP